LNAFSIVRDLVDDFQNRDKFFKYKALIIAIWVAIATASVVLSCPSGNGPKNTLGARLVMARVSDTPVVMLVNESGKAWTDVVVVVNHRYRAAVSRVSSEAPENNLTLEPQKLLGDNGMPAPGDLEFKTIELRTMQGRSTVLGEKGEK
jgi:hypothetical protein